MIYCMDELGSENDVRINTLPDTRERWIFLCQCAREYGFDGIHITPGYYRKLGLDLSDIPDCIDAFHLSYHAGGLYSFVHSESVRQFEDEMELALRIARVHKICDISIHPPYIEGMTPDEKRESLRNLDTVLDKWLERAGESGVSLTLESHVFGVCFSFDSLEQFVEYTDTKPDLGILIDISHNCYDGRTEEEIVRLFSKKHVTALHISDAVPGAPFKEGTHLPVGDGKIDFATILRAFCDIPGIFGALEIKGDGQGIRRSLERLKELTP